MKTHTRATRRRNNARLYKTRYKQERRQQYASYDADQTELHFWARKRAQHRMDCSKMCGCMMCRNPRRQHGWPADGKLTLHELKALDILSDGLLDFYQPENDDDSEVHDHNGQG